MSKILNEQEEQPAAASAEEEGAAEKEEPAEKMKSDAATVSQKIDKVSGIEKIMGRINNRAEFEQIASKLIDQASKNVSMSDVIMGLKNILKSRQKAK